MEGREVGVGRLPFPSHCGSRSNDTVFCRVGDGSAALSPVAKRSSNAAIVMPAACIRFRHSAELICDFMKRPKGLRRILRPQRFPAVLAPQHCAKSDSCLLCRFCITDLITNIDRLLRWHAALPKDLTKL